MALIRLYNKNTQHCLQQIAEPLRANKTPSSLLISNCVEPYTKFMLKGKNNNYKNINF